MAVKNKKQYYITEEHIDNDGNEYDKHYGGPYTLNRARRLMEYYFKSPYHFRNPYNLGASKNWEAVFGENSSYLRWSLPSRKKRVGDGIIWKDCKSIFASQLQIV